MALGSCAAQTRSHADCGKYRSHLAYQRQRRCHRTWHGVLAIGSGGHYAHAAATALVENTELSAPEVVNKALMIAASICVYTNNSLTIETLDL